MVLGCVETWFRCVADAFVPVRGLGCCCKPGADSPFASLVWLYRFENQLAVLGGYRFSFRHVVCVPRYLLQFRNRLPAKSRNDPPHVYLRIGCSLGWASSGYLL